MASVFSKMVLRALVLAACLGASHAHAQTDLSAVCKTLASRIAALHGGAALIARGANVSYQSLFAACDARDLYNGKPIPPSMGHPQRCSTDPNHAAYVDKYPDGTIVFSAKADVDADGSKYACGAGWPNLCPTSLTFDKGTERKSVNAEDTPFVVEPGNMPGAISFSRDSGIGAGDLAVVVSGDKCSFGVVGDSGPYFRLGEISLKAQGDIGNPQCAVAGQYPCTKLIDRDGRGIGSGVVEIIFPHSRPKPLFSQNVNEVAAKLGAERILSFLRTYAP